ncbi:hypothetical protein HT576_09635 [Haloterrigena sp. SYSU A121-1]|uniref:Uncharacterized protein n=1 Tax=Haloterrigena gelatinilytica TaxID=2741724 RepID=A0A8J8GPR0_9EURY|nr:hypothetical protein [Haloterrigena gelatinilytica]NUB91280.1 hypothetical protein [Haloterrigena gelatinilytica]
MSSDDATAERDPIVSEGRYAVVAAADTESADYWFVTDDGDYAVPLEDATLHDAATVLSRVRNMRTDPEGTGTETASGDGTELTCHDCGETWTYTGSDEHAACPNCGTEVPVEGIGP